MKSKRPKKTAPQNVQTKKVFDVTRPGRMPVSPTSRPVIVGHKPQVKDPMMSDRDDTRPLMDSTKKVTIEPGADAIAPALASPQTVADQDTGPAAQNSSPDSSLPPTDSDSAVLPLANASLEQAGSRGDVAGGTDGGAPGARNVSEHGGEASMSDRTRTSEDASNTPEGEKPAEPSTADSVASIATSSAVDMPPAEIPAPETPTPPEKPVPTDTTSGLVFDEGDGHESSTPGSEPGTVVSNAQDTGPVAHGNPSSVLANAAATGSNPSAPPATDASEPAVAGQAVVSHHKQSNGMMSVVVILLVVVLLAVVAFDILLDMGILNISNVPHTSFFSPN